MTIKNNIRMNIIEVICYSRFYREQFSMSPCFARIVDFYEQMNIMSFELSVKFKNILTTLE